MISDKTILRIIQNHEDPAVTAKDVAEETDISDTGIYKRLADLDDEGLIDSKKFGPGKGYWINESGRAHLNE